MNFSSPYFSILLGIACGILSGFGIGGGSLLMVWMTAVAMLDQKAAQGINLLYFIPTSAAALIFHIKNKMICWKAVIPAVIVGCITAGFSAWLASAMDVGLLRKLFGIYLLAVGTTEFFKKSPGRGKDRDPGEDQNNVT